jgi:hypothetical protein
MTMHRALVVALTLACATARTTEPRESCGHALGEQVECDRLRKALATPKPPNTAQPIAIDVVPTSPHSGEGKPPAETIVLFRAGKTAMNEGHWDDAYEHFVHAYLLFPARMLLLSIGEAADKSEHRPGEAVDAYRRFLATVPPPDKPSDGKLEERTRERLAALEAKTATLVMRDLTENLEFHIDAERRTAKPAMTVRVFVGPHKVTATNFAPWQIDATAGATHEHVFIQTLPAYCSGS